jgi:hypothetical protein
MLAKLAEGTTLHPITRIPLSTFHSVLSSKFRGYSFFRWLVRTELIRLITKSAKTAAARITTITG